MVVTNRDVNAPQSPVEFQSEHFDERCAAKGAKTEIARAELVGRDRRSLHRWRQGVAPGVDDALFAAKAIDTTVEKLWVLRRSPR